MAAERIVVDSSGVPSAQRRWLERIPKVELHLHLEGAIPLDALWQLITKHGGDPQVPTRESLSRHFTYRDFPHFLQLWGWKNRFLRDYEDFAFLSEAVARWLVTQGIRYAEVFYSPADFAGHGLLPQLLTEAIRCGCNRVEEIRVSLVCDLVRDFGADTGLRTLEQVAEVREDFDVVGIGIGGSEHEVPPEVFSDVYRQARYLGFFTSAHAGEAAGPESIWGAIRALQVDRIGHGTRACEDPQLVEHLARQAIPLEVCPISNVRTGVVPSIESHPVRRYFDQGLRLSINSDDPAMFGTSLVDELQALQAHLGFTRQEIRELMRQAVQSTWLEETEQNQLLAEIEADPTWDEVQG